jgi:hypothetical protein
VGSEAKLAEEEKRARGAFLTNLTVLPGLGTLIYGRRLLGLAQMALAALGFLLICAWLYGLMVETLSTLELPKGGGPYAREGLLGLGLSMAALAWSGWSGYRIWQQARVRKGAKR